MNTIFLFDSGWDREIRHRRERKSLFGFGIILLENNYKWNRDEQSIKESLQIIDNYCRIGLPDKFLDAYYKAYVTSQYEECDM